jgi:protein-disulfide isomerase
MPAVLPRPLHGAEVRRILGFVPRVSLRVSSSRWLLALVLLAPVPARAQFERTADPGMVKGPATAPVTIVEFSDYQCPYCKSVQPALAKILAEYDGRVRLIFKDFPLAIHDRARPAHQAARCAAASGKFWPYHDRLFAAQPQFDRERLITYAVEVGIDSETFAHCFDEARFAAAVERDVAEARAHGIRQTPTFLINDRPLVGAQPVETFRALIDEALRETRR